MRVNATARSNRNPGPVLVALPAFVLAFPALADLPVDELVVTSTRSETSQRTHVGNIATVDDRAISKSAFAHVHELFSRVPGVWVSRGSGQESLPAVRSPVLTGSGSCGAFLTLEDGIPSRPNGFCNINQLFELPIELSRQVEVIRGPGNALYGSNALHGTINVLMPEPGSGRKTHAGIELGAHEFLRLTAGGHLGTTSPVALGLTVSDDGGFRVDSGYRQSKGFVKKTWNLARSELTASLSASDLRQETAGFIVGEDAYRDPALNRQNLNPEAFRNANSQRLSLRWLRGEERYEIDVRPYLRRTEMEFLQHFLPGKPLEQNGHTSIGVLTNVRLELASSTISYGVDVELADVYLYETQDGPTDGSDFLRETRPEGDHYDYDVLGYSAAAFVQLESRISDALTVTGGLRAEYSYYDYSNNMLSGNTRDDGTFCGFGGCLYSRPASRTDAFFDLAPKLGASIMLAESSVLYVNLARGFRAPQMTELYRLQSGQQVSEVQSEQIDSLEFGLRTNRDRWSLDASLYAMRKKNSIYRDAAGFNVNGGRSRHHGLELLLAMQLHDFWRLTLNGTHALHRYDFDAVAARGEAFVSGRDVDTAPRWQGSVELAFELPDGIDASVQWVTLGSYFLDAENEHRYPGHDIANLRVGIPLGGHFRISAKLNNIADRAIADRADYAFGNHRYFPGRGREFFVQLRYEKN